MRLLKHDGEAGIIFTPDLSRDLPPYAIFSHTWGPASDEILFEDVMKGRIATSKPGFTKITFGARQAKCDGLSYFWVDTCCVDKANGAELSKTINSMFRWYANAEKCYVYLSDVSRSRIESYGHDFNDRWEHDFRRSRWFTRCWTLQELLAPTSVEFFSKEWERLGSKSSLERQISEITGIPVKALRGAPLSMFTVQEIFSWQENRFAQEEEDKYYSLLGIFDVSMPAIYGEGANHARRRLEREVSDATKNVETRTQATNRLFHYSPLSDPRSETRFLNFIRTEGQDGLLHCSISHASLHDPPEYVALSYYWGDPRMTTPIKLSSLGSADDGEAEFPITSNLEIALRELERRGIVTVWADGICINQQDTFERNLQVSLMGKIYAHATKVVAWVGPADDASSAAINGILLRESNAGNEVSNAGFQTLNARSVQALLSRPYWTRMWIIQELAKARVAEIWCGEHMVRMETLTEFVLKHPTTKLTPGAKTPFDALRLFHDHERRSKIGVPRMLLSRALVESRSFVASDPRDNIYAILGLTLDGDDIVGIPDYRKSVDDIFAAASRYMIQSQGLTSIILLARGSSSAGRKRSWIPDWNESTPLPPWIQECLRWERDTLDFSSRASLDTLSVLGHLVDEVCEEWSEANAEAEQKEHNNFQGRSLSLQSWFHNFMKNPIQCPAARRTAEKPLEPNLLPSGSKEDRAQEIQLLELVNVVHDIAKHSMRFVRLKHRGFRIVHQDAEHGDQIWRLENCSIPVVLRPLPNGHLSFIGEVHVDVEEQNWWELIWNDFTPSGSVEAGSLQGAHVAFVKDRSRTVCVE